MAHARYLADTSVFHRLPQPTVATAFQAVISEVAVCGAVAFELGFSARNLADYARVKRVLSSLDWAPTTDANHVRALELQEALTQRGQHRALSFVDALLAAIAEARDLTILHYDGDFELIASITGQSHMWIVPRGSAD
ncbi:MAG: PIN domain nuclease [Chloroflexi bacterium]|nr:PIN domain nuclease [Chloroflexota bacterium]